MGYSSRSKSKWGGGSMKLIKLFVVLILFVSIIGSVYGIENRGSLWSDIGKVKAPNVVSRGGEDETSSQNNPKEVVPEKGDLSGEPCDDSGEFVGSCEGRNNDTYYGYVCTYLESGEDPIFHQIGAGVKCREDQFCDFDEGCVYEVDEEVVDEELCDSIRDIGKRSITCNGNLAIKKECVAKDSGIIEWILSEEDCSKKGFACDPNKGCFSLSFEVTSEDSNKCHPLERQLSCQTSSIVELKRCNNNGDGWNTLMTTNCESIRNRKCGLTDPKIVPLGEGVDIILSCLDEEGQTYRKEKQSEIADELNYLRELRRTDPDKRTRSERERIIKTEDRINELIEELENTMGFRSNLENILPPSLVSNTEGEFQWIA